MKVFGLWERLTRIKFFDGKEVTVEPLTQTGASDKTINIPDMGADAAQALVLDKQAQTLEKKTLTSPVVDGTAATPAAGKMNLATTANNLQITNEGGRTASIDTAALTGAKTFTLPDTSGILVTRSDSGTITSAMIADGTIVDGDVSATAAIAGTKVSPNFGAQNVSTTGSISASSATVTGLSAAGVVHTSIAGALSTSLIVNDDVAGAANIEGSKLANNTVAIGKLLAVIGEANKIIRRDASGAIVSGNSLPDSTAILTQDGVNNDVKLKTFDRLQTAVADVAVAGASTELFLSTRAGVATLTTIGTSGKIDQISVENTDGAHLVIVNRTGTAVLIDNDTGTDTSRRIITGTGGPISMADKAALFLVYRAGAIGKWTVVGGTGGGAGGTVTQVTTPSAHGFTNASDKGKVLYLNGATYTAAIASASNTAEVIGILANVIDSDTFELATGGAIEVISGDDFTEGSVPAKGVVVFLSPTVAGKMTVTEPAVVGQVSKPLGIIFDTNKMFFYNMRGSVVGGANVRTQIALANNSVTTIQSAGSYAAGEIAGYITISATTPLQFYFQSQFAKNGANNNFNITTQTAGDTPPSGFAVSITAAGDIQVTLPNIAGLTTAFANFSLNAPAVGTTLPITVSGSNVVSNYKNITAAYTVTSSDYYVSATGAAGYTVSLPAAASVSGKMFVIKSRLNAGQLLTIDADGSETIDGALTKVLYQYEAVHLVSNGTSWEIF